jgi:hypothetical protein
VSKGCISPTEAKLHLRVSPGAKRTSIEGPYAENAITNAEVERFSSTDKTVLVRGLGQEKSRTLLSAHLR